jgi:hypothetical protein
MAESGMLRIQIDTVLASILSFGLLFIPLPGYADAGLRPLYWSCVNNVCEPTAEAGRDGDGSVLLGYIKESAEPGTAPLYWACAYLVHLDGCGRMALMAQPRYDDSLLLGYIAVKPQSGTVPLYWGCKQRDAFGECVALAPDNQDGVVGNSRLLGYVYADELSSQVSD